jgi:hypothetical protein
MLLIPCASAKADEPDLKLRLIEPFEIGKAPQVSPWKEGLPDAVQLDSGRIWFDGREKPIGRGVFLPQDLAWEFYARLETLDKYGPICQLIMDETLKLQHARLAGHIAQQDAWIQQHKDKRLNTWQALGVAGGSIALGLVFGFVIGAVSL